GLGRPATRPDVRHGALADAEAALQTLSPAQRTVFVLHDVEGHTLEEIRTMTGTAVSTLHARLQRARRALRAALPSEGGEA
ncbi:MAG: sigma factor-like helix-turn-helix DNA-binding protein, partial [Myxococcota bacterium]